VAGAADMRAVPVKEQAHQVAPDQATKARFGGAFHQDGFCPDSVSGHVGSEGDNRADRAGHHSPSQWIGFPHGVEYATELDGVQDG
jgi:hypothetical protein